MSSGRRSNLIQLLALALFWAILSDSILAQQTYRFESITQKQGLSQGAINAIFEDSNGLMWFGTKDGLNRYDGNEIKVYRRNHNLPNSLPNSHILSINEDHKGRIWIGTLGNNLCFLDPVTDKFFSYKSLLKVNDPTRIGENIYAIVFDSVNKLLYTGSNTGITQLDLKEGKLQFWSTQQLSFKGFKTGNIYSLLIEDQQVYVGTDYCGLLIFDLQTTSFSPIPYGHTRQQEDELKSRGTIMDILVDKENTIWVAAFGDYVLKYDRKKQELIHPDFELAQPGGEQEAYTRSLALVGDTAVWVTTEKGYEVFDIRRKTIQNIPFDSDKAKGLSSNGYISIHADNNQGVWLGGNGYGLNYYFPNNKGFKHIENHPSAPTGLTFKSVRSIYHDSEGQLFVGGYGGLDAFDSDGNRIWTNSDIHVAYVIHPDPVYPEVLWVGREGGDLQLIHKKTGHNLRDSYANIHFFSKKILGTDIMSLCDKNDDELWVGTENGLNLVHKKTAEVFHFIHNPDDSSSIPIGKIRDIYVDTKRRTWLASIGGGLSYMENNDMRFINFSHDPTDKNSISSNVVNCIFETMAGDIYIGTESGLNLFNPKHNNFTRFNTSDGLINDVVYRIESDSKERLWLSTNQGLSCFDPIAKSFRNYNSEDGLQDNEFNSGASFKDKTGKLYFGGINGLTAFRAKELNENSIPPKVLFTKILVGGEPLIIDPPITQAKEIKLDYDNQSFYLEFAALNFYKPEKNQYAYRIKEISDKWHTLGNTNSIELIRLGYGTYTIEVIGANNDNYWNSQPTTLIVHVAYPFWASYWFIILAISFIFLLFYAFYLLRMQSLRRKKELLEKEIAVRTQELLKTNKTLEQEVNMRKKTEEELKEANLTKDKFFSIIAHDLKNPFNVLLGLSEILDTDFDFLENVEKKEIVTALRKSTDDLYRLLENLLSWSRAQQGKIEMKPTKIRLSEIIDENIRLLKEQAKAKNINLQSTVIPELHALADYNAITTVVRNLLSNAIKFTNSGGHIDISSESADNLVLIAISDSGTGIEQANMEKLFRIDEQFKREGTMNEKGTGLGLAICKEFTEANNGTLSASSVYGEGSTFTIALPKA